MTMLVQDMLNAVAVWGPWVLAVLMAISAVGIWRHWHQDQSLPLKTLLWRVVVSGRWSTALILSVVGLYLLKVQCAPLTDTLVTLRETKDERVPDISFRRVADDTLLHLHEFEGKVVVLNLWATWCPPCLKEMPTLDRLQASYKDRGLVVITLSDEPRKRLQEYFEKHPVGLVSGYTSSFKWIKIETFRPFTLIIDRKGILRRHIFGELSYEDFESYIRPYL